MGDWNAVNLAHQQGATSAQDSPELGRSKCNVDASFYKPAGHTGWGWCIRNSQGQFMAAVCNWIREKLTTIEGEGMANIFGLVVLSLILFIIVLQTLLLMK
jgi:hypothetical protein